MGCWAMFGATQQVDMKMTRANSFGCYNVAVFDPSAVPTHMDVIRQ